MTSHKKFYFILIALILILAFVFYRQIVRTQNIRITKSAVPLISQNSIYIPVDETDPIFGNPGAPITVVEFMDMKCEQCKKINKDLKEYITAHPQAVRLVWKDDPQAGFFVKTDPLIHQAAYCAHEQNKFWQFTDTALNSKRLNEEGLKEIARGLNMNETRWWSCANLFQTQGKIQSSVALAKILGIKSLPALFINNKKINIVKDFSVKDLLDQYLTASEH